MKKSIIVSAIFMFAIIVVACSSPTEKVEDAKTDVVEANKELDDANVEYMADMAKYKTETAEKIAANEVIIKDFNTRIASQKKDAQVEYRQKVAELEQKNTDMKKKMDDYKLDGKENWEKFKTEFNHDMDELGKAFKDLTVNNVK
ncbi:hypothetical protein GCM10027035_11430 [Emticicia sediminis]